MERGKGGGASSEGDSDFTNQQDEELHRAVFDNRRADVLQLIDRFPLSIRSVDRHQQTPLHVAAARGNLDLVLLLALRGGGLNAADKNGWTPLHRFVVVVIRELFLK